jgi:hypothetical protein
MEIKSFHMKEFLQRTGLSHAELGKLLNVSPLTIRRWEDASEQTPDPTSTAFLVLIPLLLSAGVDILPEPSGSAVAVQTGLVRGLGMSEDELDSEIVKNAIRRSAALISSPEVKASRDLFNSMADAWRKIDDFNLTGRTPRRREDITGGESRGSSGAGSG